MKIRIKFAKYGIMRFIGHLDMMRYFQKAMRRADIDIAYSEGYSPHQIMSFAAPLGVGITSKGEYMDIEVHSSKSSEEALKALNEVMAEGVSVLEYRKLPEGAKNAMSSVAAADYLVYYKEENHGGAAAPAGETVLSEPSAPAGEAGHPEPSAPAGRIPLSELSHALEAFFRGQEEILITKQTKKGEKTLDLKPLIYDLQAVDLKGFVPLRGLSAVDGREGGSLCGLPDVEEKLDKPWLPGQGVGFYMKVCTGSTDNVKPEQVLIAFSEYCRATGACGFRFVPFHMQTHRMEIYAQKDGELIPLGNFGQEIA